MYRRLKLHQILFFLVVLLSAFLRLYRLGSVPAGLNWDEASIAYNAYGISTVYRDEWLQKLPMTFRAFGEYKGPVAIYAVALTTKIFGVTPFTVRLPMALAGIATVIASYWLGLFLFRRKEPALLLMFLLAVSPLSIHYSRIAFESTIGIACIVIGTTLFFYAAQKKWFYVASAVAFVLAIYANHSSKIFLPLYFVILVCVFYKEIWRNLKWAFIAAVITVVLLLPLALDLSKGKANERFFMTSSIMTSNRRIKPWSQVGQIIARGYMLHLTPGFLLQGEKHNSQDGNGVYGILSIVEASLGLLGILVIVVNREWRHRLWWVIPIIVLAIFPAAISQPAPHSNRVIHIIPWVQILAVVGYWFVAEKLSQAGKQNWRAVVVFCLLLEMCWHTWVYFTSYYVNSAQDFQYGYQQIIDYTKTQEGNVHEILFTTAYQQPYIYLLLYRHVNPIEYHNGNLNLYKIQPLSWNALWMRKNVLIVGTPEEIPFYAPNIVYEVLFPDGSVAFRVVKQ